MKTIICGAGIAGLTLAWWLRRDGWDVTLVEQADRPRADGYLMDFFGSGYDVAERMGLLPALARVHTRITELSYVDTSGRRTGGVRYAAMTQMLRGRVFSVMRGELERILRSALIPHAASVPPGAFGTAPKVRYGGSVPPGAFGTAPEVRYGTSVAAVHPAATQTVVELTDGTRHRVDLLVGADGIHSRVRGLVFGPQRRFLRHLGFHTASYLFDDPDLRSAVGDRFAVVAAPGRQAGLYPTNDGRLATSLIHACPDPVPPDDPRRALQHTYAGLGEWVDRALAHCPRDPGPYYDQVAQVEMDTWSRGPVTLVGDACQAVSLMAGQGASMAMGGAWVLARELGASPGGEIATALARYEQRMRPFIRRQQRSGRRAAHWMVPDSRWRIRVRNQIMSISNIPGGPALLRPTLAAASSSVLG